MLLIFMFLNGVITYQTWGDSLTYKWYFGVFWALRKLPEFSSQPIGIDGEQNGDTEITSVINDCSESGNDFDPKHVFF